MSSLADWFETRQASCIIKSTTGYDCPGCGAQRALTALLRGDFAEAWHHYPPIFVLLSVVILWVFVLARRSAHRQRIILYSAYVLFAAIAINYIAKLWA